MASLGWALSEVVSLSEFKDEFKKEKRRWKLIFKVIMITLLLLAFFGFVAYQVWQAILSYRNPVWSSSSYFPDQLNYPGILICPPVNFDKELHHVICYYTTGGENNTELPCVGRNIRIASSFSSGYYNCLDYNFDSNAFYINEASYLFINATVKIPSNQNGSSSSIERKASIDRANFSLVQLPIYIQLYSQNDPPTELHTTLLIAVDSTTYILLTRVDNQYLNNTVASSYVPIVSSASNIPLSDTLHLEIYMAFSTKEVTLWQQQVTFDWITAIGIMSGAMAFLRSIYVLAKMVLIKIERKIHGESDHDHHHHHHGEEEYQRLLDLPPGSIN